MTDMMDNALRSTDGMSLRDRVARLENNIDVLDSDLKTMIQRLQQSLDELRQEVGLK